MVKNNEINDQSRPGEGTGSFHLEDSRILVVEDRVSLRTMLAEFLLEKGFAVDTAGSIQEGRRMFHDGHYHLALLDLKLPDGSGMDLLKTIRQVQPVVPVILMTAYGTIEESVQAIRMGAVDFIQKPLHLDHLYHLILRSIEFARLQSEVLIYREEFRKNRRLPPLISCSTVMNELARQIQKIAATDATVLLSGESGTGKELFARTIHLLSPRRQGPFVELNCAAIPETLMENELFGHIRGAYTGAESTTRGKFELAAGGTLFLDEIGEMPLTVQSKLLKALEMKKVTPIGGNQPLGVDVRIVVATNRELEREVRENRFRGDLYFRLAQFPVSIPPLRQRREDILPLVDHFLHEVAARYNRPVPAVAETARTMLLAHSWPGNVRELRNLVERAVIVDEDGLLDETDLFPGTARPAGSGAEVPWAELPRLGLENWLHQQVERLERAALEEAAAACGQDRVRMAGMLGLSPRTLAMKMKKHFPDSPERES